MTYTLALSDNGDATKAIKVMLQYADSFGVPSYLSSPVVEKINNMVKSSGAEYATSYMKALKVDFIRIKAGLKPCQPWSISKSRRGFFKGLVNWCKQDVKRWSKAICLLQVYTNYYSSYPTLNQVKKFKDGVLSLDVEVRSFDKEGIFTACSNLFTKVILNKPSPHILNSFSANKRAPHVSGSCFKETEMCFKSVDHLLYCDLGRKIHFKYKHLFDPCLSGFYLRGMRESFDLGGSIEDYPDSVGCISYIQEPGFKLRAIANPSRVYQSVLKPLGDALFNIIRDLPWDCTHNQSKSFPIIQKHLSEGKFIHSIDLTGATDYFPLSLQMMVLKNVFCSDSHDHIDLFYDICRSPWYDRIHNEYLCWTKGQPLGLYPSFASFALTHGVILYYLNDFSHDNKFFILGDDVVILDTFLYSKYIEFLEDYCCPLSTSKSLVSNIIAEFSGKIITSNKVICQFKWRNPSDDSFIDIVRNIGPRLMHLLKPKQRKICKILFNIPEFLGGLGFNPNGIPLIDRIALYYKLFDDDGKQATYLMNYNSVFNDLLYNIADTETPSKFSLKGADFDLKSIDCVIKVLPLMIKHYKVLGSNLFTIDPLLGLQLSGGSSRRTTLDRLSFLL